MNQPLMRRLFTGWPLAAVVGGLLAFAAIFYGCDSRRPVVMTTSSVEEGENCITRLRSGLDQARPNSLGLVGIDAALTVRPKDAAKTFSQWLRQPDCRTSVPAEPVSAEGKTLIARLLGAEGASEIEGDRFTAFDAAHVRDALLDFALATQLGRDGKSDLERATRLFDYVSRTVSSVGDASVAVPQTAYEAHLFGRGSAEERALLFASLLRQLRIDAVVLRPGDSDGKAGPWWVGVLLEDGIYLFDSEVGLPVPAGDAAPTFLPRPATWAQAVAQPELLLAYRREAGLPGEVPSAEQMAGVRVELIGPAAYWRTAMERIELSMPEDRGALLYDPLQDTAAGPGLFRRVADSGGAAWTEEAIGVWPYPEQLERARNELSSSQKQRLEQRVGPYLGPFGPNSRSNVVEATKSLWRARIEQMSGRAAEGVIARYLHIRHAGTNTPGLSPNDDSLNRQAADEAYYWEVQAKLDIADFETAAATAREYIERGGDRADEATGLLALSLAATGKFDEASAEVAKLPEGAPGLLRLRWLAKQWKGDPAGGRQ